MRTHTEANGPASSGAAPVPSEAAIAAQDPHIKWWVERQASMAEADRLSDDTLVQEASERIVEIVNRITDTIPRTLEGLVVQLRLIAALAVDEHVGDASLAVNALSAAERLAGGALEDTATTIDETADAGDERLLDLEQRRLEARAQRDRLNVEDDEPEDERLYNLCFELEEEIAKAPAHTVAGIAAKIRVLHDNHERGRDPLTYEEDCVSTALEALERLGGGAPASRSWPIGPCYTLRQDAPHHDLKAGDTVITSPEPGWRDDGLYVIRLMGDDGEVPHVASQIK